MRIDNQDISRVARQLRDEENQQLHVSPWNRRSSRFRVPAWLVATPAAAVLGFVLGLWVEAKHPTEKTLETIVDTIYIKVHEPVNQQRVIAQNIPVTPAPAPTQTVRTSSASHRNPPTVGRPFADDHIRYDLLSRN